jgi:hypothetical protein
MNANQQICDRVAAFAQVGFRMSAQVGDRIQGQVEGQVWGQVASGGREGLYSGL